MTITKTITNTMTMLKTMIMTIMVMWQRIDKGYNKIDDVIAIFINL